MMGFAQKAQNAQKAVIGATWDTRAAQKLLKVRLEPSEQDVSLCAMLTPGRKGKVSVLDCIAESLKDAKTAKTFRQLADEAAQVRNSPVSEPNVRSVIYRHSELFEKAPGDGVTWRLSKQGRKAIAEA